MPFNTKRGLAFALPLVLAFICLGQEPAPAPPAATPAPGTPSSATPEPAIPTPGPAPAASSATVAAPSTLPSQPQEPYIIEDGGLSFEPIYWFNFAQPNLRGGAAALTYGSIGYPGDSNRGLGGEFGIPAGHSHTLRISYFRVQGNSNTTVLNPASIFGENYNPGDYISSSYTIQSAKISWDVLGYTWYRPSGKIRLKELYEMQFVNVASGFDAPLKPFTINASGNPDYNQTNGSKMLFYPTFGLELEEALGRHFRWEVKGSGFGVPHHADIWDAQADIAVKIRNVEVLAGEKAYHFKTSPQTDEYFTDTLSGAFVGLRYYFGERPE